MSESVPQDLITITVHGSVKPLAVSDCTVWGHIRLSVEDASRLVSAVARRLLEKEGDYVDLSDVSEMVDPR